MALSIDSSLQTLSESARRLLGNGKILRPVGSGCTSRTYICERANVRFCLKDALDHHFADWIEREQRFLVAIADTGLPHAEFVDFKRDKNSAALLLEYIEGESATSLLARTSESERQIIWSELGKALNLLHRCPVPPKLSQQSTGEWLESMLHLAQSHLTEGRADGGSQELLDSLKHKRPMAIDSTLIHGDCTTDNILFQNGEFKAFIDFPFGAVGDRRQDLAYLLEGPIRPKPREVEGFKKSYGLSLPSDLEIEYFQNLYLFF